MNDLSLMLYLSEIIYSITNTLGSILVLGWFGYALATLISKLWASDIYSWDDLQTKKKKEQVRERPIIPSIKWLWLTGAAILFINLVPSKEVFYMIVASEAGEAVVKTPEAQEIMNDVREIIDIQLEKLKQ